MSRDVSTSSFFFVVVKTREFVLPRFRHGHHVITSSPSRHLDGYLAIDRKLFHSRFGFVCLIKDHNKTKQKDLRDYFFFFFQQYTLSFITASYLFLHHVQLHFRMLRCLLQSNLPLHMASPLRDPWFDIWFYFGCLYHPRRFLLYAHPNTDAHLQNAVRYSHDEGMFQGLLCFQYESCCFIFSTGRSYIILGGDNSL